MFPTLPLELKHLCLMIQDEGKGLCFTSLGPLAGCMYSTHIAQEERALEEIQIHWTSFIVSSMPMLLLMSYNFYFSWTSKKSLCLLLKKHAAKREWNSWSKSCLSSHPYTSLFARIFQGYYTLHRPVVLFTNQETERCTRGLENNAWRLHEFLAKFVPAFFLSSIRMSNTHYF